MKIILLDRDGTLIVKPPDERIDSFAKVELFPDTIKALKALAEADYGVIMITNQAGIAEGRLSEEEFWKINNKIIKLFTPSGVKILKTYLCPHVPKDRCICRKPHPTMLQWAAEDFDFDPADIFMIGDRPTDVAAGKAAGTKTILVQTTTSPITTDKADYITTNLVDAVNYAISH